MPHRYIRRGILLVWMLLALTCPAGHAQEGSPARAPATRPAQRAVRGTVKSIDPATGEVKLAWRHPSHPGGLDFLARLDAHVQVAVDGKPGTLSDVKPADRVTITGEAKPLGGQMPFVISRIEVHRQAATRPSGAETDIEGILDRLEKKGNQVRDIQTEVTVSRNDPVRQNKQVFQGILRFKEDKPNPRFLIRFDKVTQRGATRDSREWHVFDGQWYHEAREQTKTIVKRQVVRPGEQAGVFCGGQGPFPLPFGQKKSEIQKFFQVKLIPSRPDDPPNSLHLEYTPKAGTDLEKKYGKIDSYVDKQLDLPVRVSAIQKPENVEITADFPAKSVEINRGLPGSGLNLPDLENYTVESVPLGEPAKQ